MFGKEGKRTDYTPYSCMKVILSNPPSQGDHHGEFDGCLEKAVGLETVTQFPRVVTETSASLQLCLNCAAMVFHFSPTPLQFFVYVFI